MMLALENVTIILRYGDGAIGLTGWGWVVVIILAVLSGRS